MQALNYPTQALEGLEKFAKALFRSGAYEDVRRVKLICDTIHAATHFQIPDGGRILDDNLRGIRGQQMDIVLPFPEITVSFALPASHHKDIPGLPVIATRRMPIAFESGDNVNMVSVYRADEVDMWSVSPVGIRFNRKNWEPTDQDIPGTFGTISDTMDAGKTPRFVGKPFIILESYVNELIKLHGYDDAMRIAMDDNADIGSIFELIEALSCKNVGHEPISKVESKVNERRAKSGKLPLFDIHTLTIEAPGRTGPRREHQGGTHASPREHRRRGHIRRMPNGEKKLIFPVIVNPGVGVPGGKSTKTWYRVVNAKNR